MNNYDIIHNYERDSLGDGYNEICFQNNYNKKSIILFTYFAPTICNKSENVNTVAKFTIRPKVK